VYLGHRLHDEQAILAPLERDAILAERLGIVGLLSKREPKIEMGERLLFRDLESLRGTSALLGK
jgi:hypothetical protein